MPHGIMGEGVRGSKFTYLQIYLLLI